VNHGVAMAEVSVQRRGPARAASATVEEIDSSNIDDGGGDRWSRVQRRGDRRGELEFWDESKMTRGRATIYKLKNISSGS
jgi:hypothetical protein